MRRAGGGVDPLAGGFRVGALSMATVARPHHVRIRPAKGWSGLRLGELWEFRDVLLMLALRDVKLRYKQTALGVLWVVLQPLAAAILFAWIFGRFGQMPSDGQPYGAFVLAGLVAWQFVAGILQRAGPSVLAETKLVTKVYFPRLLVPLASAGAVLIDLGVALVVGVVYLLVVGVTPGWTILWLPFWIAIAFALASGLGLWLAAMNVRYRDFMHATPFLLQLWMFASPVVYAFSLIPERWQPWFACNPMVGVTGGFRAAFFGEAFPLTWATAVAMGCAVVALWSGAAYFRRVEQSFADQL